MHAIEKLARALNVSSETASILVSAGYTTPRSVRSASDNDLLELDGIGDSEVTAIRARYAVRAQEPEA